MNNDPNQNQVDPAVTSPLGADTPPDNYQASSSSPIDISEQTAKPFSSSPLDASISSPETVPQPQVMPDMPPMQTANQPETPSFGTPQASPYAAQSPDYQNQTSDVPPQSSETPNPSLTPITAVPQRSTFSKFKTFIIVSVVAIVAIYSVVAFLYMQNQKLKNGQGENATDEASTEEVATTEVTEPTPSPEPIPGPDTVKIVNGDIVLVGTDLSVTPKVLVNKSDYTSTGITGFASVAVSPDTKSMCFESWPPAPEPALFIASTDGTGVSEVSPNRNGCLWAPDSKKIFYTGFPTTTQSVDIYMYDLSTDEEVSLTASSQSASKNTVFDIIGLSADSTKLVCTYQIGKATAKDCEIDLETLEVSLF